MRQPDDTGLDRVVADPVRIAHAAGAVLDAARDLADTTRPELSTVDLAPEWFGTLPAAGAIAGSHAAAVADAQELLERLEQALEQDADGLYQVAFSVQATDRRAVDRLGAGWNR